MQETKTVVRVGWGLIFLTFSCLVVVIISPAIQSFSMEKKLWTEVELVPRNETQYPTLTFCAVQQPDRWNFPRILLNQVDITSADFETHGTLNNFISELISHQWMAEQTIQEKSKNIREVKELDKMIRLVLTSGKSGIFEQEIRSHMTGGVQNLWERYPWAHSQKPWKLHSLADCKTYVFS